MKRSLIVGGSIGAVVLLMISLIHPVIALDANRQKMNDEKDKIKSAIIFNIFRTSLQKHSITFNPWESILTFIFSCILSLILWFYINIWANIGS